MTPATLVCSPSNDMPGTLAYERWCRDCGAGVWVSASMLRHVDAGRVSPVCLPCAQGILLENNKAMIHPDQVEEMRQAGVYGFAKDMVTTLNREARRRARTGRRGSRS